MAKKIKHQKKLSFALNQQSSKLCPANISVKNLEHLMENIFGIFIKGRGKSPPLEIQRSGERLCVMDIINSSERKINCEASFKFRFLEGNFGMKKIRYDKGIKGKKKTL
ncbi:hypothetical protein CEXT_247471 [Caerostris extrusa]|uniref:LAGLIDADG homing endonuclease n=1 Tax=Caerostris extrusa TaxID=172846 RepID=A0AAV4XTT5_CAEEX|nr:hypothetical protein CEXT_247471 [Caerostris extrusa]